MPAATAWWSSLASVVLVSLVSLVGLVGVSIGAQRLRALASTLMSFAVGTLLGDAFIHLIPETFAHERPGAAPSSTVGPSLLVLAGVLLFFVVEKLLRHHHGPLHEHVHPEPHHPGQPALAAINLFGDAIHNFIDGALIAASYLASPALGVATTVAVLFHEIPQEMGDFGVLIHAGLSVRRAVWLNLASASTAVVGTLLTLGFGQVAGATVSSVLVPITAGGFVYIAAADLIPELHHERGWVPLVRQAGLIALGIAIMGVLRVWE